MDSESKMGCRNVMDRFQHPKVLLWKANGFCPSSARLGKHTGTQPIIKFARLGAHSLIPTVWRLMYAD